MKQLGSILFSTSEVTPRGYQGWQVPKVRPRAEPETPGVAVCPAALPSHHSPSKEMPPEVL